MKSNKVTLQRTIKANLDDIVFKGRNQNYGAYRLRKEYPRHLRDAFLYTLAGLAVVATAPLWVNLWASEMPKPVTPDINCYILEEPKLIDPKAPEPEPLPKMELPKPPDIKTLRFTPPDIVRNEEVIRDATVSTLKELEEGAISNVSKEGKEGESENELPDFSKLGESSGQGSEPVEVIVEETEPKMEEVNYDNDPQPVNMDDFKKKLRYPTVLSEIGMNGKVTVRVLLDKEGNISKHHVLKSTHPLFVAEVEKQLYKIKFTPATRKGKAIKAWVTLPVVFALKKRD